VTTCTRAALIYLHSTDERQREIANALGELAAKELKRRNRAPGSCATRSGTAGARQQKPASRRSTDLSGNSLWPGDTREMELPRLELATPCLQNPFTLSGTVRALGSLIFHVQQSADGSGLVGVSYGWSPPVGWDLSAAGAFTVGACPGRVDRIADRLSTVPMSWE
jgi:hypothetical protein